VNSAEQCTAVTVQRKLKIRKRKRKQIYLQFRFKCWQCCRRSDFRRKRVPCPWCSCRKSTITNCPEVRRSTVQQRKAIGRWSAKLCATYYIKYVN